MKTSHHCTDHRSHKPHGKGKKGPGSYWMQDADRVFDSLNLQSGHLFLDLGCGPGDFSIHAARIIGNSGTVYAFDGNADLISGLKSRSGQSGHANIKAAVADITKSLDLEDQTIDVCLAATVLHTIKTPEDQKSIFRDVARVLKPTGHLAVIECNTGESFIGPPPHMRLSPRQVEEAAATYGFIKKDLVDLGNNYLILFSIE